MGASKTGDYTEQQINMSLLLKSLGHPARIAILEHLLKVNACICGDIVKELPLAQPTISQHLKELKNAGIIKGTVEGTSVCYCINEKAIAALKKYFSGISDKINTNKNTCC
jgi:ArsR family transcriptional regulator, arsenate/arsenite/antimonite-responsive transcriptional repressor